MDRTIIHVMRHGEVDNPTGVLYGRLPGFGLTELGYQMAARAAQYLVDSGADIARVISSPLLRAQLTAAPTAAAYGLSIATDPRLIESDNVFEGLAVNSNRAMLANPKYYKYYCNPLRPSWGEPYRDVASRMSAALSAALREARGREALLVSLMVSLWRTRLSRGTVRSRLSRRLFSPAPRSWELPTWNRRRTSSLWLGT